MHICDILHAERVFVDPSGDVVTNKADALRLISELLAPALSADRRLLERLLVEREKLQSTGIGDGVAIPHTSLENASGRAACLIIAAKGVPFDSIDGQDARIILGVIGPREATGDHLRVLARVSRLLRDTSTRATLIESRTAEDAYELIRARDQELR